MLEAVNLTKRRGGRSVVSGVSLNAGRGEVVGLLGRSGSGKTTIFRMVAGLLRADSGAIRLNGEDVTDLPMFERARRGVCYLPQEPSLFPGMTVEQNILFVLETRIASKQERRRFLDRLLTIFDIAELRSKAASGLSGGERRRTEIARAIALNPDYVLLDEPFTGIDPLGLGELRSLLRVIARLGIGVLVTDHNVRETLRVIDRAYILEDGRLLVEGAADAVIGDPAVVQSYLGQNFHM